MISYNLQIRFEPFTVKKLNTLEEMSILTAATTIYCGLLYLTNDISEEGKIILFVLIMISNGTFLLKWIFGLIEALAIILI